MIVLYLSDPKEMDDQYRHNPLLNPSIELVDCLINNTTHVLCNYNFAVEQIIVELLDTLNDKLNPRGFINDTGKNLIPSNVSLLDQYDLTFKHLLTNYKINLNKAFYFNKICRLYFPDILKSIESHLYLCENGHQFKQCISFMKTKLI